MYEVGDLIVYGRTGICEVTEITTLKMDGVPKDKLYYILRPVREKRGKVFTPVDNEKIVMRRVISKEEAEDGTLRKLSSLKGKKVTKARLNFGGNANELWCEGGELRFLLTMIEESRNYRKNCGWFPSLVSKEKSLGKLTAKLKSTDIAEHRIIEMHQGTKTSRILAWRF